MDKKQTRIEVPMVAGICAYAVVVDGVVTEFVADVGQLEVDEAEDPETPESQEAIEAVRDALSGSGFMFTKKFSEDGEQS